MTICVFDIELILILLRRLLNNMAGMMKEVKKKMTNEWGR